MSALERAEGSVQDSLGNCMNVSILGSYFNDKDPVADSNYVIVAVNVAKAGLYTIKTDLQNGFMFADSGIFSNTGLQFVTLKISGKPVSNAVTTFNYSFDTTACSFSINVRNHAIENTTGTDLLINTWEFTDSTDGSYHSGVIVPNTPNVVGSANGYHQWTLMGSVKTTYPYDSVLYMVIYFPPPFIQLGDYDTKTGNYFTYSLAASGNILYESDTYSGGKVVITITSVNTASKYIKGEFGGYAFDGNGDEHLITRGRFYSDLFY